MMDYSKIIGGASDEALLIAVIETLEGGKNMSAMAWDIRRALSDDHLKSIAIEILSALSEEIELTDVSEAECETLKLNAEGFKGEVA